MQLQKQIFAAVLFPFTCSVTSPVFAFDLSKSLQIPKNWIETERHEPERDAMISTTVEAGSPWISRDYGDYTVKISALYGVTAFDWMNTGKNRIVTKEDQHDGKGPNRWFVMDFPERARQDITLMIMDSPNENTSEVMVSSFYFFPRRVLPRIQWPAPPADGPSSSSDVVITLPNEETFAIDPNTKEIRSGVLTETGPLDLNPSRFLRKFARIEYSGKGVMIRVNKRGEDPRLNTTAEISKRIGSQTQVCKVASKKLFRDDPKSNLAFLFPTDAEFNEFLKANCKFSLN
jgi:hypothetical protein